MADKIDSNVTGLAFAEEASLKTLPGSPVWFGLEPNSYSDFGGETTNVARAPIDPTRQRRKGTITDLDASGGFNSDMTQTNLTRLLQGFFFADAREKPSTAPFNGTAVAITAIALNEFQAASGLDVFLAGHLVKASNFADTENNGLALVSVADATGVTVTKALTDDGAPAADAYIEAVGFQFATGDINVVASASSIALTATAADFTTLGLTEGEWIFVGGDATANQFANNSPGYARIKSIAAKTLSFDDTTFTAVSETGTGLDIQIFFGTVIRNENTLAEIVRRSYNIERQLGNDGNGVQSEYLEGAICNEFTLNIPQADKLNADLTFVAMDNTQRTGTQGVKAGTRVEAPGEEAFNTSSNIYRLKLNVVDPTTLNPTGLFGYVSEATIAVNNNVSGNKAIGTLGSFEATAGDFEVSGSVTAYFSTVAAVSAVRNNSDVAMNIIGAARNAAFVYDIPLLSLGGGRINVEKDAPITLPVETNAAKCDAGYTLLTTFLPYVPNVGMPT